LEIEEIFEIHARSKTKMNLVYQRVSGRCGHCYIDPNKPLQWSRATNANHYGHSINDVQELIVAAKDVENFKIGVWKQCSKVQIFVKPEHLWIHSKNTEAIVKILYGKTNRV